VKSGTNVGTRVGCSDCLEERIGMSFRDLLSNPQPFTVALVLSLGVGPLACNSDSSTESDRENQSHSSGGNSASGASNGGSQQHVSQGGSSGGSKSSEDSGKESGGAKSEGGTEDAKATCSAGRRFVDNKDGTVTDCSTTQMWVKSAPIAGDDKETNGGLFTWQSALDRCDGLSYGGYDDWALPTKAELLTILQSAGGTGGDYAGKGCRWDADSFAGSCSPIGGFWSSNVGATELDKAYLVGFGEGDSSDVGGYLASKEAVARARCVRHPGSASSGGTGGAGNSGSSAGSGGSKASSSSLCPSPYRCAADTKIIDGLEREYSIESCNPATGKWTQVEDCSDHGCSCKASTKNGAGANYANCSWGGSVCSGIEYTW
jgi:hypothetical protein